MLRAAYDCYMKDHGGSIVNILANYENGYVWSVEIRYRCYRALTTLYRFATGIHTPLQLEPVSQTSASLSSKNGLLGPEYG